MKIRGNMSRKPEVNTDLSMNVKRKEEKNTKISLKSQVKVPFQSSFDPQCSFKGLVISRSDLIQIWI